MPADVEMPAPVRTAIFFVIYTGIPALSERLVCVSEFGRVRDSGEVCARFARHAVLHGGVNDF